MTQDQAGLQVHGTKTTWFASETMVREDRTVTVRMLADALLINKSTCHQILWEDLGKRISRLFKWLRRWSSQTFRKRYSPAAFRTCRNAGNSVLTVKGTTSKGTGSISCEVEFCIFYRLSLRTLWTKDVYFLTSRSLILQKLHIICPHATKFHLLYKNYMFRPISGHPRFHNWSSKRTEEEIYIM